MRITAIQTPILFDRNIQYYHPNPEEQKINIMMRYVIKQKKNKGTERERIERKTIEKILNIFFLTVKLGKKHQRMFTNIEEEKRNKIVLFFKMSNNESRKKYNIIFANHIELFETSNSSQPAISLGKYNYFYFDVQDFHNYIQDIQQRINDIFIENKPNYLNSENRVRMNELREYVVNNIFRLMITGSINEPSMLSYFGDRIISVIMSRISKKNLIDKIPYLYVNAFQKLGIINFVIEKMNNVIRQTTNTRNLLNSTQSHLIFNQFINIGNNFVYFIKFANNTKFVVFQTRDGYRYCELEYDYEHNKYRFKNINGRGFVKNVANQFNVKHINDRIERERLREEHERSTSHFREVHNNENEGDVLEGLVEGGKKKKKNKKE